MNKYHFTFLVPLLSSPTKTHSLVQWRESEGGRGRGDKTKAMFKLIEHVVAEVGDGVLAEVKGEDSLGNTQAEGVGVGLKQKKKKMKPGRKSKKGLVGNGDEGLKGVAAFGGVRKRPERNTRLKDVEAEENGAASVKKRGEKGSKREVVVKGEGKKGDMELKGDTKGGKKRAKTEEEVVKGNGKHAFRRLREQKNLTPEERRKWIEEVSMMCHQCQRSDKGRVVRCRKCKTKRYCVPCVENWYPHTSEEAIAEACPVCCGNCNCKACLRLDIPVKNLKNQDLVLDKDARVEHSKYIIHALLPSLKRIHDEQTTEVALEARRKGLSNLEVQIPKSDCAADIRVY